MKRLGCIACLFVAAAASHGQVNGNAIIIGPAPVMGASVSVSTSTQFAGAISSLRWGSKEFISDWDHGRQLALNTQLFNRFNCYNPYEAGSIYDTNKPVTSSRLLALTATGNRLESTTQMAWYLRT